MTSPTRGRVRRVAMVSEHASPLAVLGGVDAGGQNVHVAALATHLARLGTEVVVHTRRDDPHLPGLVPLAPGVTVHHVDAGPPASVPKDELFGVMDRFAAGLHQQWSAHPPDVVHTHFWMSGYAGLAAARPLGIPVVHTFHALGVVKRRHQGDRDTSPAERQPVERDLLTDADHVIATCTDEVVELLRLGGQPRRMSVVPCGVDLTAFGAPGRPGGAPAGSLGPEDAGPSWPPPRRERNRLLCVGRVVERKGIGDVVAALAAVPDTELVIAGGPERHELSGDEEVRRLTDLADAVGVVDRVRFLGRVGRSDLPALMRSADVVVCVPWYEPFGIVPLEAMACGVPVVASAVGGIIDTVVDGCTGVHVPPRHPSALADALGPLLGDPARRARLGTAGADRVRSRYAWPRIAVATLDVYAALVRQPTVPDRAVGATTDRAVGATTRPGAGRPGSIAPPVTPVAPPVATTVGSRARRAGSAPAAVRPS